MGATVEDLIAIDRRYHQDDDAWRIVRKMKGLFSGEPSGAFARALWRAYAEGAVNPARLRDAWWEMGREVGAYDGPLFIRLMRDIAAYSAAQTDAWRATPWGSEAMPGWPTNFHGFVRAKREVGDMDFFAHVAAEAHTLPQPYANAALYHGARLGGVAPASLPDGLLPWAARLHLERGCVDMDLNPWPDEVWARAVVEASQREELERILTTRPRAWQDVVAHASPAQLAQALRRVTYTTEPRLPVFEALASVERPAEVRDAVAEAIAALDLTVPSTSGEWEKPDPLYFLVLGYLKLCQVTGATPAPAVDPAVERLIHTYTPGWSGGYFDEKHGNICAVAAAVPDERLEALALSEDRVPFLWVGAVPTAKVAEAMVEELSTTPSDDPYHGYSSHALIGARLVGEPFAIAAAAELKTNRAGGARRGALFGVVASHGNASTASVLIDGLKDRSKAIREVARSGIARLPAEAALDAIEIALNGRAKAQREEAAHVLLALEPSARGYALAQARLAQEKTKGVRALLEKVYNPSSEAPSREELAAALKADPSCWSDHLDHEDDLIEAFVTTLADIYLALDQASRVGSPYHAWLQLLRHLGADHERARRRAFDVIGGGFGAYELKYRTDDLLGPLEALYGVAVVRDALVGALSRGLVVVEPFKPSRYTLSLGDVMSVIQARYTLDVVPEAVVAALLGDRRKTVRRDAEAFLLAQGEALRTESLVGLLDDTKKHVRDGAIALLGALERAEAVEALEARLAKAKGSTRKALEDALAKLAQVGFDPARVEDDAKLDAAFAALPTTCPPGLDPAPLPSPRWRSTDAPMSKGARRWLLHELGRESMEHEGEELRHVCGRLRRGDLETLYEGIFDQFDPADLGWPLFAQALLASDARVEATGRKLEAYASSQRFHWSEDAVEMFVRRGTVQAVCVLDEFSRKTRRDAGRWRARAGLNRMARRQDMTVDELLESAVSTLGFDEDGARRLDYGARVIVVTLGPDGLSFAEEGGRSYKNLPSARKDDDAALVARARAEVARVKKELKRVHKAQIARLGEAMLNQRRWLPSVWRSRYADHPLMRAFAQGIVWGAFAAEDDRLLTAFSLDAAGAAVGADGAAVELEGEARRVGIAHPALLSAEERAQWLDGFKRQGRTPSLDQLERRVRLKSEVPELKKLLLELRRVQASNFVRTADRLGYTRGAREDAGAIKATHRRFGPWRVCIDHTWYIPEILGDDHEVEVEGLTLQREGDDGAVELHELPDDVFSELVCDLHMMTRTPFGG